MMDFEKMAREYIDNFAPNCLWQGKEGLGARDTLFNLLVSVADWQIELDAKIANGFIKSQIPVGEWESGSFNTAAAIRGAIRAQVKE